MKTRRPWTAREDELLRAVYQDPRKRTMLARMLGRSQAAIRMRASAMGIAGEPSAPWLPWEDSALMRGILPAGRTWTAGACRARRLGIKEPEPRKKGPFSAAEDLQLLGGRTKPKGRSWDATLKAVQRLGIE